MAVLQYLGEVEVERMTLVNNLGMGVNILPIFKEISIFQHINLPTLTAEIEIEEATGFSEVFPILGMERLDVTFRTKTGLGQFEKSFNVTSMTQKENVTNKRAVNYLLHCVSGEYFKSETKRISKTYSGTISDIINDIYKEHIKILKEDCYMLLDDYDWNFYEYGKNPINAINLFLKLNKEKIEIIYISSQILIKKIKS